MASQDWNQCSGGWCRLLLALWDTDGPLVDKTFKTGFILTPLWAIGREFKCVQTWESFLIVDSLSAHMNISFRRFLTFGNECIVKQLYVS